MEYASSSDRPRWRRGQNMGKMKSRQRLHVKAAKLVQKEEKQQTDTDAMDTDLPAKKAPSLVGGGLFSNTKIDVNCLAQELPDWDTRSAVTSKSLKGMNLTKKEKMKLRKEVWMKKMDVIQSVKKEEKARKKRQKTAVVGDMKPLEDMLPTLELLLKDTPKSHSTEPKPQAKPKAIKKVGQRKKDMMADISLFHQVLQHPAYQSDPLGTISEHLQNKHKQEQQLQ